MTREINVFQIQISSSSKQVGDVFVYITLRLHESDTTSLWNKSVTLKKKATAVICEPPIHGRSLKLQAIDEKPLELCEVEIYGTGI